MITVKDCLKYTLAHEASSAGGRHGSSSLAGTAGMNEDELEQTLEDLRSWLLDVKAAIQRFVIGRDTSRLSGTSEEDEEVEGEIGTEDGIGLDPAGRNGRGSLDGLVNGYRAP